MDVHWEGAGTKLNTRSKAKQSKGIHVVLSSDFITANSALPPPSIQVKTNAKNYAIRTYKTRCCCRRVQLQHGFACLLYLPGRGTYFLKLS